MLAQTTDFRTGIRVTNRPAFVRTPVHQLPSIHGGAIHVHRHPRIWAEPIADVASILRNGLAVSGRERRRDIRISRRSKYAIRQAMPADSRSDVPPSVRRWLANRVPPESRYACCPWMAEYEISRWACTVNRVAPSSVYARSMDADHTCKSARARRDQFDLLPPSIRCPADEREWFELEARRNTEAVSVALAGPYRSGRGEPPL